MILNQKGVVQFILILAVAVVGLFLVGYNLYKNGKILIYFTPQEKSPLTANIKSDTSDWEEYINSEFGFVIKYPTDLIITEEGWVRIGTNEKGYWQLDITDKSNSSGSVTKEIVQISIWPNPKTAGGKLITKIEDSFQDPETPSYFSFEGYSALRYETESLGSPISKIIGINFLKNNTLWTLRGTVFEGKLEHYERLDQILSTFEFIDEDYLKNLCEEKEGEWLSEFDECDGHWSFGFDESECKQLGGVFDECASSCRHQPKSKSGSINLCTADCHEVCKFSNLP